MYTKTPRWDKKGKEGVNHLKWAYEDYLEDAAEEQKRQEWIANTKARLRKRKAEQLEGSAEKAQKLGEVPLASERA